MDRIVAIKVLPPDVSKDPVRKQRFEREAKTISNLNHPHICVLHDVGHQEGIDYLVMECIESESLAQRLEKGALSLEQVLKYGAQIADALDKAHRSGVVHRDLKPGNIMLTKAGAAKLLDFGLAKPTTAAANAMTLTASTVVTMEGVVSGTFQYMSPEQVEGKEVDARSDIFSLGAVLYEMVTGQRAFQGKSQLSVASAIVEKEPESIGALRPMTPPAMDHVIRKCLAKHPDERWQSAADIKHELDWIAQGSTEMKAASTPVLKVSWKVVLAWMLSTAAVVTLASFYWHPPSQRRIVRSDLKAMPHSSFLLVGQPSGFALSPDGTQLAYVAQDAGGKAMLWIRRLDSSQAKKLDGTEDSTYPFWSAVARTLDSSAVAS